MKQDSIAMERSLEVVNHEGREIWRALIGPTIILGYLIIFLGTKVYEGRLGHVHWLYMFSIGGLYFLHNWTRSFVVICLPMVVYGAMYDFFAFIPFDLLLPINISGPYQFDKIFFGIAHGSEIILPHEYIFQALAHPFWDTVSGIFYFLHIPGLLILILYFWLKYSVSLAQRFTLAFLCINVLAFTTYLLYPAAAPWYVAKFGFAQPLGPIPGDPAGLVRFEQLFGLHLFTENYGISPVVFGAVPSMHAGYATLGWLFSFKADRGLFIIMTIYILGMYFSALYLQHHYLFDVIIGVLYALMAWFIVEKLFSKTSERINQGIWSTFKQNALRPIID